MTVYRDAGHCIARIMSIETNDGTVKSGWQSAYQSGWPEARPKGSGLSAQERLTQDCMAWKRLHRKLRPEHWHAIVAKRSINRKEAAESIRWLARRAETPAHDKFRIRAVTAWVSPKRSTGQQSTRALPESFYLLHTWDDSGRPEGTLRRWKWECDKWLNTQMIEAHNEVERILQEAGWKIDDESA